MSVDQIEKGHTEYTLKDDQNKDVGEILIKDFKKQEKYTITDALRAGWRISVGVAIDFTMSNGELHDEDSLHFVSRDDSDLNQYEQSIYQVCSILEQYDTDKLFPVYGFGGIPHYNKQGGTSHCFSLG